MWLAHYNCLPQNLLHGKESNSPDCLSSSETESDGHWMSRAGTPSVSCPTHGRARSYKSDDQNAWKLDPGGIVGSLYPAGIIAGKEREEYLGASVEGVRPAQTRIDLLLAETRLFPRAPVARGQSHQIPVVLGQLLLPHEVRRGRPAECAAETRRAAYLQRVEVEQHLREAALRQVPEPAGLLFRPHDARNPRPHHPNSTTPPSPETATRAGISREDASCFLGEEEGGMQWNRFEMDQWPRADAPGGSDGEVTQLPLEEEGFRLESTSYAVATVGGSCDAYVRRYCGKFPDTSGKAWQTRDFMAADFSGRETKTAAPSDSRFLTWFRTITSGD
ncbi:hypothetical protein GW17_00025670 [Ensete ventricosum]|nr:hypothetical protein GW17_00025670 [Ensete ventricosum]